MVWISKERMASMEQERKDLQASLEQVKGYYEGDNGLNLFFKSIAPQLQGQELAPFKGISRENIKKAYETVAPVQGVINYIADNVGEVMRYLELTDSEGNEVENHWLKDLLRRPNDRFSLRKFGQAWAVNKLLYGDAWVYAPITAGADRCISEMYVIPSHRVSVSKGGEIRPLEGIRITGSRSIDISMTDNVFESFDYNLDAESFFGTSKIVSAAVYLSILETGMRRQNTALKNGGVANIITPARDSMGVMPKDADSVTERFNNKDNTGKTIALRAPIDVHRLGDSASDLSILSSHQAAVEALCFVYKLPVDLYLGQAKYENAKEAKKTIYEQNAIPLANEFAEDLMRYAGLDEEGLILQVNTDRIEVLQDDPGDVLKNLSMMHASLNEMREAYGYDPIEEEYAGKPMLPVGIQFGNELADIQELQQQMGNGGAQTD